MTEWDGAAGAALHTCKSVGGVIQLYGYTA